MRSHWTLAKHDMTKTAKLIATGGSQAVLLPAEFRDQLGPLSDGFLADRRQSPRTGDPVERSNE
jgi:hypothetical protein